MLSGGIEYSWEGKMIGVTIACLYPWEWDKYGQLLIMEQSPVETPLSMTSKNPLSSIQIDEMLFCEN